MKKVYLLIFLLGIFFIAGCKFVSLNVIEQNQKYFWDITKLSDEKVKQYQINDVLFFISFSLPKNNTYLMSIFAKTEKPIDYVIIHSYEIILNSKPYKADTIDQRIEFEYSEDNKFYTLKNHLRKYVAFELKKGDKIQVIMDATVTSPDKTERKKIKIDYTVSKKTEAVFPT